MFPIKMKVVATGAIFDKQALREIIKGGWKHGAEYWHRHVLPKHFTAQGAAEYGFAKRTAAYMKRKARQQGHQRPLVFTGATERAATRVRDVRPTSKGAAIVLRGLPSYIWKSSALGATGGNQPNMVLELQAATEADAEGVAKVIDRHLEKELNKSGQRRVNLTGGHRGAP